MTDKDYLAELDEWAAKVKESVGDIERGYAEHHQGSALRHHYQIMRDEILELRAKNKELQHDVAQAALAGYRQQPDGWVP